MLSLLSLEAFAPETGARSVVESAVDIGVGREPRTRPRGGVARKTPGRPPESSGRAAESFYYKRAERALAPRLLLVFAVLFHVRRAERAFALCRRQQRGIKLHERGVHGGVGFVAGVRRGPRRGQGPKLCLCRAGKSPPAGA